MNEPWLTRSLGEVVTITKGRKPPRLTTDSSGDVLPYATADFLRSGISTQFVPSDELSACVVTQKGCPVLIWDGSNAGEVFVGKAAVLASTMAQIRPDETVVDPTFCYFFLKTAFVELNEGTTGSTIPHVSKLTLTTLKIPTPELAVQRLIAGILFKLECAIEMQVEMVKATAELKRAAMTSLFTRGLRGGAQKEAEIGLVPESWEIAECEHLAREITVGVVVRPASYYVAKGVPAFRSLNIKEDRIDSSSLVHFSAQDNDTVLSKSKLRVGDVLIVRTGYPGTSCVVPHEFDGANCIDLVIVRPNSDRVVGEFLSRFLNSEQGKSQALSNSHGLAQKHLNVGAVRRVKIPIPSTLDEQREIVAILDTLDRRIVLHREKRGVLEELFRSLLHKLMTGEIRVSDLDLSRLGQESEPAVA